MLAGLGKVQMYELNKTFKNVEITVFSIKQGKVSEEKKNRGPFFKFMEN